MAAMLRVARAANIMLLACGHGAPAAPPASSAVPIARPLDAAPPPPPDAPLPLDEDPARVAVREVALYDQLAAALAAAGDDCDAASTRIGELVDANLDAIAAYVKIERAGGELRERLHAALAMQRDHLDATMHDVANAPAMRACAHHAGFTDALDRLRGGDA